MSEDAGIRVALLHPMRTWVDALEILLARESELEVVAAHTSLDWLCTPVQEGCVDLLLLHIDGSSGVSPSALIDLRQRHPALRAVVIGDEPRRESVSAWVRAGVRGWLGATASFKHLLEVVTGVAQAETWFPPRLTTVVIDVLLAEQETRRQKSAILASLSARELDVLSCLAGGMSRQEIAELYVVSPHTVRTHINNVLRKLDVHSTLAAVSIARQVGLVACAPPQLEN
jgi:DNA-binding NarL/FixJ family response regulator